jgi:peptidoglycan/LPS O-acetylase OafA/YrhL
MSLSHAAASDSGVERLHGLDALRCIALLLGLVLHASLSFMPLPIWIADNNQSAGANILFFAIHLFRMAAFFLIAGYFAHLMIERRGVGGFVRDRLKRIAGPLVAFWPIVLAGIIACFVWDAYIENGYSMPTESPPQEPLTVDSFPLTHLWFLWVLLVFYAVLVAGRALILRLDRNGSLGRSADAAVRMLVSPWALPLVAAPLAATLYWTPGWMMFFGIPTPDRGLIPDLAAAAGFGTAFLLGFLIRRQADLLVRIAGYWRVYLGLAVGAGCTSFVLADGLTPSIVPPAEASIIDAALYAFAVFASTFAALALALRFLGGHRPAVRYLADSSYWLYIVHLPVVMAGQLLVQQLGWPWPLKLAAVIAGALLLLLATYELLVRHSFLGRFLNGRKVPWSRRAEPTEPRALPAAA